MLCVIALCSLLSIAAAASAGNETQILLDDMKKFRDLLVEMPDSLVDIESKIDGLIDDKEVIQRIQEFRKKFLELPGEFFDLEIDVTEITCSGEGKDEEEEEKEDSENQSEECGLWHLGMNLNPADGHIMDYTTGWSTGTFIGSKENALGMDFLDSQVWKEPADFIAIVRHQHGVVDAVKVFKFKHWGISLLDRFKDMDPGRMVVTSGGPIQESIADDAANLSDDPIFSVGGDLAFNWINGDNGHRIVMTEGFLAPLVTVPDVSEDNTHGLGNHFACRCKTNTENSAVWKHEISNIQDCPWSRCRNQRMQGTDHGRGASLKSGPVYGNYAIFVSKDAASFPEPGFELQLEIGKAC